MVAGVHLVVQVVPNLGLMARNQSERNAAAGRRGQALIDVAGRQIQR
jgi:hypothetical protein